MQSDRDLPAETMQGQNHVPLRLLLFPISHDYRSNAFDSLQDLQGLAQNTMTPVPNTHVCLLLIVEVIGFRTLRNQLFEAFARFPGQPSAQQGVECWIPHWGVTQAPQQELGLAEACCPTAT